MGFFNANASLLADTTLLFQIAIMTSLLIGLYLKSKRRYKPHGAIMGFSFVLHVVFIFVVMVPSLLLSMGLFDELLSRLALMVFFHSVLGIAVLVVGVYPVAMWLAHRLDSRECFKNKRVMQTAMILWIIELILGIAVYIFLYVS